MSWRRSAPTAVSTRRAQRQAEDLADLIIRVAKQRHPDAREPETPRPHLDPGRALHFCFTNFTARQIDKRDINARKVEASMRVV